MTKKTDKDFRIVEQVVNAQLAERDAEIAALRAELAGVIEGHKAAVELWQQQDYNNSTEIARLRQQVAELQANTRSLSAELERCNQLMLCPPLEAVTELSDWFDRFRGAYDK